jgi:DNA-directed RNA polymerase specialized sigma subunit
MILNNDILIQKAKEGDKKAMASLIKQFYPLIKREAKKFQYMGLEFDDAFQQAALLFITGVYQYKKIPPITFAGFMKKRIKWGLWGYWRKQKQYRVSGM